MISLLVKRRRSKLPVPIGIFVLLFLVALGMFTNIFKPIARMFHQGARPIWEAGTTIDAVVDTTVVGGLQSKRSLIEENKSLQESLARQTALLQTLESRNITVTALEEIINRKAETDTFVLAEILAKPSHSPYGTLIIDTGTNSGIEIGDQVLAYGNIPMGTIREVSPTTAIVGLYTRSKEITPAFFIDSNVLFDLVGKGGGNFEAVLPRELLVVPDTYVLIPGRVAPVAIVGKIISDPRDPFQKVIFTSPVNIEYLRFVEVVTN